MSLEKVTYGILTTIYLNVPYKNAQEKQEAEEYDKGRWERIGYEVRFGDGLRKVCDWGYTPAEGSACDPIILKSGDKVCVFKTISVGKVSWEGNWKSMSHLPEIRQTMFDNRLPARLITESGLTIHGALTPFFETGTEGIEWCIHEYGKTGYDGLERIRANDQLTVYDYATEGEVEWEGVIECEPEKIVWIADFTEVLRETKHVPTKKWLEWSWQNRPIAIASS